MRQLLLSSLAAGVLLAATAGTALMASVTQPFCVSPDGLVAASIVYDNVSGLISTVQVVNSGSVAEHMSVQVYELDGTTILFDASGNIAPGTKTINVSGANEHMISFTSIHGGQAWALPVILACGS